MLRFLLIFILISCACYNSTFASENKIIPQKKTVKDPNQNENNNLVRALKKFIAMDTQKWGDKLSKKEINNMAHIIVLEYQKKLLSNKIEEYYNESLKYKSSNGHVKNVTTPYLAQKGEYQYSHKNKNDSDQLIRYLVYKIEIMQTKILNQELIIKSYKKVNLELKKRLDEENKGIDNGQ